MSNGKIIGVDLTLDQNYLKVSVEKIVKAGIAQALGDPAELVKHAIDHTINKKVDREGNPSNSSYGTQPYLDWLANKIVEDVVREEMKKVVENNTELLRAEMCRQLGTKEFINDMAGAFIKSVFDVANYRWQMPVKVSFEPPEEAVYRRW